MKFTRSVRAATGWLALLMLVCGACSTKPTDPSDAIFDGNHVLEVSIVMAPGDWDTLRNKVNSVDELLGPGCMDGPRPSHYKFFPAAITVDGQPLAMVGVRKKGFLGSASATKPSLKVSFGEYVAGQELMGVEKLTLNNANQDISLIKQCLAFKAFRDAGLPASRCNFAHLTVNGNDLGIYANVETVSDRLLNHFFTDGSGKLYEGQFSDFRSGWSATYENKDSNDKDRSDIDAVIAALAKSDTEVAGALGAVLDLDAFRAFWAMETLVAAWDGYTNNLNNHFVYHDPTSGKFFFLPWGPDISFDAGDAIRAQGRPQSVSAAAAIPRRLYGLPEQQALYVTKMNEILDKVWKEKDLLADIDHAEQLISPFVPAAEKAGVSDGIQHVREFVNKRRATITAELLPKAPDWPYPPSATACYKPVGKISGSFKTTWDTTNKMNPFMTGSGTFALEVPAGSTVMSVADAGAAAGLDTKSGLGVRAQIQLLGAFPPDSQLRLAVLNIEPEQFVAGRSLPFNWQSAFGVALDVDDGGNTTSIGLFNHGMVKFDEASRKPGGAVSGTFSADLIAL